MSYQDAPTQLKQRETLSPDGINPHWRTFFRIDCQLTQAQFTRLENAAFDVPGVSQLRFYPDQQLGGQHHSVVSLEYHSVTSELQAQSLAERFMSLANARLDHPAGSRRDRTIPQPIRR